MLYAAVAALPARARQGEEGRRREGREDARRRGHRDRQDAGRRHPLVQPARRRRSAGSSTRTAGTKARRWRRSRPRRRTRRGTRSRAITVEYEVLPFVVDYEDALKPNAPASPRGRQPRRATSTRYSRATSTAGFAAADVVLEATYTHGVRDPRADRGARVGGAVGRRRGWSSGTRRRASTRSRRASRRR